MQAPFSLFIALRYLKPKRTFVSLITVISVLGVTLGITVLIVVIAVMTGFDQELRRKVLGFEAHLLITNNEVLQDWRTLDAEIQKTPGVVATAPFVQGPVIAEFHGRRLAPKIRGIDLEREERVTEIRSGLKRGTLDLSGNNCIIGKELAQELGVDLGDVVSIYSPGDIGAIVDELNKAENDPAGHKTLQELRQLILPADLTVTGIFESGRYVYDSEYILVPLHIGQELYGLQDGLHGLTVKTTDPYKAGEVQERLRQKLPATVECLTWIDMNHQMFDAIRVERNVMFIILIFMIIIASFCIMTTLITVTVQKTREIGLMKALGAETGQIIWIFLGQGMFVGFLGNVTGLALGMALIRWRNGVKEWLADTFHVEIFPPGIYQFTSIPAEVVPHDVAVICASAFVICSVAALAPAWFAARLDPVKALRYE